MAVEASEFPGGASMLFMGFGVDRLPLPPLDKD
jgi:hypothetical protein